MEAEKQSKDAFQSIEELQELNAYQAEEVETMKFEITSLGQRMDNLKRRAELAEAQNE